ncbi:MAG TPA: hypothetical protein VM118_10255, partial [Acidobacteriota bacterium]|nr:hypothetical protein [Acidobacteriota bacterium]
MPVQTQATDFPDTRAITRTLPSGPTRGTARDWLAFQIGKMPGRLAQRFGGRAKVRPHRELLQA